MRQVRPRMYYNKSGSITLLTLQGALLASRHEMPRHGLGVCPARPVDHEPLDNLGMAPVDGAKECRVAARILAVDVGASLPDEALYHFQVPRVGSKVEREEAVVGLVWLASLSDATIAHCASGPDFCPQSSLQHRRKSVGNQRPPDSS